jgi:hypothetical protein
MSIMKALSLAACLLIGVAAADAQNSDPVKLPQVTPGYGVKLATQMHNPNAGPAGTEEFKAAWKIQQVGTDKLNLQSDNGCTITRSNTWFSPALQWDCPGDKGSSVVDWQVGSLWPLKAGNKAYFHRVVQPEGGKSFEQNWRCTVDGIKPVTLAGSDKAIQAYEVTCTTEQDQQIWYWKPGDVSPIRYVRKEHGVTAEDSQVTK